MDHEPDAAAALDDPGSRVRTERVARVVRTGALAGLLIVVAVAAVVGHSRHGDGPLTPAESAAHAAAQEQRLTQARQTLAAAGDIVTLYEAERANAPIWAQNQDQGTGENLSGPGYRVTIADGVVTLARTDKPRCVASVPTVYAPAAATTSSPTVQCGPHTYAPVDLAPDETDQRARDVASLAASIATTVRTLGDGTSTRVSQLTTESLREQYAPVWGADVDVTVRDAGSPAATLRIETRGCTVDASLTDDTTGDPAGAPAGVTLTAPTCD